MTFSSPERSQSESSSLLISSTAGGAPLGFARPFSLEDVFPSLPLFFDDDGTEPTPLESLTDPFPPRFTFVLDSNFSAAAVVGVLKLDDAAALFLVETAYSGDDSTMPKRKCLAYVLKLRLLKKE